MAAVLHSHGLHHAISLGNIDVSSKSSIYAERCYESEDENMGRRRLRTSSSSELYPRTSVYSKGDIREQYCLTDRQLSTIERPRRERLFGCLSRRGAPQSFLGVCVGRRAPSDENLAAYAPFYRYPRYCSNNIDKDLQSSDINLENPSYFRRQPASILSSSRIEDASCSSRHSWMDPIDCALQDSSTNNRMADNMQSIYSCSAHPGLPPPPPPPGPSTPRTKHVSFARSHTLTSFDDVSLGLRLSGRIASARSQERLIGGKKTILTSGGGVICESGNFYHQPLFDSMAIGQKQNHPSMIHQQQQQQHQHGHSHLHSHSNQHQQLQYAHSTPPAAATAAAVAPPPPVIPAPTLAQQAFVQQQQQQPQNLLFSMYPSQQTTVYTNMDQSKSVVGGAGDMPSSSGALLDGHQQPLLHPTAAAHTEFVIVEKIKRNTMKTQATQTEIRKDPQLMGFNSRVVETVMEQTSGGGGGGIFTGTDPKRFADETQILVQKQKIFTNEHEQIHRTQSEEPQRSTTTNVGSQHQNSKSLMSISGSYQRPKMIASTDRSSFGTSSQPHPPSLQDTDGQSCELNGNQHFEWSSPSDRVLYCGEKPPPPLAKSSIYHSNSLPRHGYGYHCSENEFYSHSLPRMELAQPESKLHHHYHHHRHQQQQQQQQQHHQMLVENPPGRRLSITSVQESNESPFRRDEVRRRSMPIPSANQRRKFDRWQPPSTQLNSLLDDVSLLATVNCHRSAAEEEEEEEKEIFIDFKPHISPTPSLTKAQRRKKLHKTQSDGINRNSSPRNLASISSASSAEKGIDDDVVDDDDGIHLYENMPVPMISADTVIEASPAIEEIVEEQMTTTTPTTTTTGQQQLFRERSSSLEGTTMTQEKRILKSAPPSPCQDDLHLNTSTYPSSDSLANDLTTRDHSDGIWNESQVTVVTANSQQPSTEVPTSLSLLTPSSRRKSLILQHQQRSSVDTDFLDLEEQFPDQNPNLTAMATTTTTASHPHQRHRDSPPTIVVANSSNMPPTPTPTPSLAFTTVDSLDMLDPMRFCGEKFSKELRIAAGPESRKSSMTNSQKCFEHVNMESVEKSPGHSRTVIKRRDSGAKIYVNNTDISECSTNTDEYATCTDTSKYTPGIKTPPTTTSSSSTTQVPVSAQSSQTERTHDGSSFESASSLYSGRGDGFPDDPQPPQTELIEPMEIICTDKRHPSLPNTSAFLSPTESMRYLSKVSPSHSLASTSSESYTPAGQLLVVSSDMNQQQQQHQAISPSPPIQSSPSKMENVPSMGAKSAKKTSESISDEDASEMRYSSSGYYESPLDDDAKVTKFRRYKLEEERKKRKANMKLDIEHENLRALTSPIKKVTASSTATGANATDGRTENQAKMNVTDTVSPSKMKRIRPKIRRQFRRSSRDEPQKLKNGYALGVAARNTERLLHNALREEGGAGGGSEQFENVSSSLSPKPTHSTASTAGEQQPKAKSIESLRSVSPGSDSVFYSETDGTKFDHQVQCLHCGKEVDSLSKGAVISHWGSQESIPCIDKDDDDDDDPNPADIVKPPADFADSPLTTKTSHRLYKKMEKRFRSEERHYGDRGRHYKTRQENIRAKSEERGKEKDSNSQPALRPAGSSPCVLPEHKDTSEQKSQIIYWGHYDNSRYMRLTDFDVWMQLNHQTFYRHRERMPSTESEKSFHSKYQVILHRLVQRRCTLEMYHRQRKNTFKIDKTVVVNSNSGEFGFRIHGSKPVVVAAIEPDTPAESSGLEVGDIIVSVNGVTVLDKHHTEVVKIAHAGCETLKLDVARTIGVLLAERQETSSPVLLNGYLWRRQSCPTKGSSPNNQTAAAAAVTATTAKWVRRWFCLRVDHCLYFYKTEKDIQPVGATVLAKHTIESCPVGGDIGKPFAFKIASTEGRTVILAADTEELATRWMTMLKRSAALPDSWMEKASRNLQLPANCIDRPDCIGYLLKLGARWSAWSKRYCVLKDACLYFYQEKSNKMAFGMACLHGYKVASMSSAASGKKNSFEIIPPESKFRHFYFSTDSEMDKKRWISALEYSIDRWIKSG